MAGRIPQEFIDQLLSRIDIVDLIDGYVPLKKAGVNYKACCPFHDEKTPSFSVSATKQFYHCFGCGQNGSAISFLMDYDHMSFPEAIEKLASIAGMEVPREAQAYQNNSAKKQGVDLYELMEKCNEFYQGQLRTHAQKDTAIHYLQGRGLSGEIAKRFGLGFAPAGWDNLMSQLANDEPNKKALVDTGMLSQNDNGKIYDRFRERVMFPIHDHRGRVVGFGGRIIDQGEPKYLNSPETPIFHKGSELYGLYAARGAIRDMDSVLVVEGYMDVVALAQHGVNHAVATLGTATTKMHLQRLFRHTQNIVFSFDGDRAGRAAAWKALQTTLPLLQDGLQISFLFLPDDEDPDTMVNRVGKDEFLKLIENSTPLPEFFIDSLSAQADLSRLDGRAKLAQLARPLLNEIPDCLLKKLMVDRIGQLSDASAVDLIINQPSQSDYNSRNKRQAKPKFAAKHSLSMTAPRKAISLLIQNPELASKVDNVEQIKQAHVRGSELLAELIQTCQLNPQINTAALLERYRQENHFSALEKLASHDHLLEQEQIETEFLGLVSHLVEQTSDQRLEFLINKAKSEALSQAEKSELTTLLSNR
jgi:DNA primase